MSTKEYKILNKAINDLINANKKDKVARVPASDFAVLLGMSDWLRFWTHTQFVEVLDHIENDDGSIQVFGIGTVESKLGDSTLTYIEGFEYKVGERGSFKIIKEELETNWILRGVQLEGKEGDDVDFSCDRIFDNFTSICYADIKSQI